MQDNRTTNKRRGYVPKGEQSKAKTIFARGDRYTSIAIMCTAGLLATKTFIGSSDKITFMDFIVEDVVRSCLMQASPRSFFSAALSPPLLCCPDLTDLCRPAPLLEFIRCLS